MQQTRWSLWYVTGFLIASLLFQIACSRDGGASRRGPYLGETPPGSEPQLFAEGFVSTRYQSHSAPAFSPDGNWMFWSAWLEPFPHEVILYSHQERGVWSRPEVADFSGRFKDGHPFFSHDGRRLYFNSNRPELRDQETAKGRRLWFVEFDGQRFTEPHRFMPGLLNGGACSMSENGDVYFTRPGAGGGNDDIVVMRKNAEGYDEPAPLPGAVNTPEPEFDPVISPDGRTLLFTAFQRPDALAFSNLYVSFRQADGAWMPAVNLGESINRANSRFASWSPDGRYIFFTSRLTEYPIIDSDQPRLDDILKTNDITCGGTENVYWVEASLLDSLRKRLSSSGN